MSNKNLNPTSEANRRKRPHLKKLIKEMGVLNQKMALPHLNPACMLLLSCLGAIVTAQTQCRSFDSSEEYYIVARHSRKALSVDSLLPDATAIQLPLVGNVGERWRLEPAGNGHYKIFNVDTAELETDQLLLSLETANPGELIRTRAESSMPNENSCFVQDGDDYYSILNQLNNLPMDVAGAHTEDGTPISTWPPHNRLNQDFMLIPAYLIPPPHARGGVWENSTITLPFVPVAGAHLADGRMVVWSSSARFTIGKGFGKTHTAILDPFTRVYTEALVQNTSHDMFCPGTAVLPDTRIMITGGSNSESTTMFDPRVGTAGTWTRGPDMKIRRGYHSMTVLSDGSVFTVGGSWNGGLGGKLGEVWDAATGTWSTKKGIRAAPLSTQDDAGIYRADNHMWLFTAPNGKVFHAGPSVMMHWIDTAGNGWVGNSIPRGNDTDSMNGNAVMFDIGKILKVGGAKNYNNGTANKRSYVIDINGGEGGAVVERTSDMVYPRSFCNSVVLPSGQVVVVGGMQETIIFSDDSAVLAAEIWDPTTGEFTLLSSMMVPRTYHSFALLLKDGRVLVGGGGFCGDCGVNHPDAQILTPPYLLDAEKNPLPRPEVVSAPPSVTLGSTFSVQVDSDSEHSFALMRLGAATHSVNNDQRRIPLESVLIEVLENGNGVFEVTVAANPAVALPGAYFFFAMNVYGVPSVATTISILVA